ncbi:MAG: ATP synthase F0 subunit A [Bacteroidetes bacterium GWF2_38_335]|nr:MAG: ATP synthase F0 subunit A [Bacteroidetes bacterium GWF2_38_335]OFY81310.1 MAG: ATP synthase F0 subunit A [Bacteroidetes bacterium RIFOXYA12_FULL_38_20]HBS85430.1 ATP synthase F0 subunit A [Bacteroidales bacterium]
MHYRQNFIGIFFIITLMFFSLNAFSNEKNDKKGHGEENKFQPGSFILHHILDAHEWHIGKFGEQEVSIPLPVILFTEKNGLVFFMSNKFEGEGHGPKQYGDYLLEEGKIKAKDGSAVYDFSITKNVVALLFSFALILWVFISVARSYTRRQGKAPKGLQSLLEPLILFVRDDVAKASIGEKKYEKYMPYLLTIFFFIFINNLLGLIPIFPGGANLTGNIAVTMVLALFTFIITTFSGNKGYWKHIINAPGVPWWLKFPLPLMPIVEIIGVFTKPFVLMVRLFANITAGHIIALGFFSLIFIFGEMGAAGGFGISPLSVGFALFMSVLELLVAFIQAYVFTLLSALYFGMATEEHHSEAHAAHGKAH